MTAGCTTSPTTPPTTAVPASPVLAVLAGLPALALALAGLFHPHSLTAETAATWTWLHLAALFLFPLVGAGLVVALRGRRDALAWAVRLGAYVYATAYTALDVMSGVTAGFVTGRLPEGAPRPDEVRSIFAIGGPVGEVGSWALVAAATLLALDLVRRYAVRAVAALLLPVGAWCVHLDHIFAPVGVLGMVLLAVGTVGAVWSTTGPSRRAGERARASR